MEAIVLNNRDLITIEAPLSQQAVTTSASTFQTTIVGYGRYGNNYIGPKYAKSGYSWEIAAIVDPRINSCIFERSVLGEHKPQTSLFQSFTEWYENYFTLLNDTQKAQQVIEIALKPELVYEQVMLYIEAGVKHFILPKPVVINQQDLLRMTAIVQKHQVKAAVASQWHYSDIPKIIRREVKRMMGLPKTGKTPQSTIHSICKVEVNFSKENGLVYATTPPLLELPHALQLLTSIGLIDFDKHVPEVSGTDTVVNVIYRPDNIRQGVHIQASIDMQPSPHFKSNYPTWDIQERSLKIYFEGNSIQPDVEADFWIKFNRSGDVAIRPGKLVIVDADEYGHQQILVRNFIEDQLLQMNLKIYESFQQNFIEFQNDSRILSLERYASIGQQIMLIQHVWESVKDSTVPTLLS